jgi:hypothetical protein
LHLLYVALGEPPSWMPWEADAPAQPLRDDGIATGGPGPVPITPSTLAVLAPVLLSILRGILGTS